MSCVVVALLLRNDAIVLPDTCHFRVRGRSVTRERWNQLTTTCRCGFNFTWLSWRKAKTHPCHGDGHAAVSLADLLSCTKEPAVRSCAERKNQFRSRGPRRCSFLLRSLQGELTLEKYDPAAAVILASRMIVCHSARENSIPRPDPAAAVHQGNGRGKLHVYVYVYVS